MNLIFLSVLFYTGLFRENKKKEYFGTHFDTRYFTGNLNNIPDLSGQPGQNPGFLFKLKWPVTDYFPDFPNGF